MTADSFRPQNRLLALEQELQSRQQASSTAQPAHRLPQRPQNEPIRQPAQPPPTPPAVRKLPKPPQRPAQRRPVAPAAMPLPTPSWQTLASQLIHSRSTRPIVPSPPTTLTSPAFIPEPPKQPIDLEPQPIMPPGMFQFSPALPQPKPLPLLPPVASTPPVPLPEPDAPPASWQSLAAKIHDLRTSPPPRLPGSAPSAPAEADLIDLSHLFT